MTNLPTPITGADVSRHQPPEQCDWEAAKEAGLSFAICKTSEGRQDANPYVDPAAIWHLARMRRAGLIVGTYHFARPDNRAAEGMPPHEAGVAEAEHAVMTAEGLGAVSGHLPLVLDLETYPDSWGHSDNNTFLISFRDRVRLLLGVSPLFYLGPKIFARRHTQELADVLGDEGETLWLARPDGADARDPSTTIPGWPWGVWQYTHSGSWAGLPSPIDLNRYRGSSAELHSLILS